MTTQSILSICAQSTETKCFTAVHRSSDSSSSLLSERCTRWSRQSSVSSISSQQAAQPSLRVVSSKVNADLSILERDKLKRQRTQAKLVTQLLSQPLELWCSNNHYHHHRYGENTNNSWLQAGWQATLWLGFENFLRALICSNFPLILWCVEAESSMLAWICEQIVGVGTGTLCTYASAGGMYDSFYTYISRFYCILPIPYAKGLYRNKVTL